MVTSIEHKSGKLSQQPSSSPLPAFYFHGVLMDAASGAPLAAAMAADGGHLESLSFSSGADSTRSLREQVTLAIAQIRDVVQRDARFGHGYNFIAFSQGSAVARGVIEDMDDHNVHTFISLAGTANGIFFGPQPADQRALHGFVRDLGPALFPSTVFDLRPYCVRSSQEQQQNTDSDCDSGTRSILDSVNDNASLLTGRFQRDFDTFALAHPELEARYSYFGLARSVVQQHWRANSTFLAEINNVTVATTTTTTNGSMTVNDDSASVLLNAQQQRRRNNFLRLHAAHFFASPDDGVIAPWQSSILGQYSELASVDVIASQFALLRVLGMHDTREYVDDLYGLQTLDRRGGLHLHVVDGVAHDCWLTDDDLYGTAGVIRFTSIYDQHLRTLVCSSSGSE